MDTETNLCIRRRCKGFLGIIGAPTGIARIIRDTIAMVANTSVGCILVDFGFFTCIPRDRPFHHNWFLCPVRVVEHRRVEICGAEVEGFICDHTYVVARVCPPDLGNVLKNPP